MKAIKKIIAAAAAAMTVGVFGIGAVAATQSIKNTTSFNVIVPDRGNVQSGPLEKTNKYVYATVHLNEGSTVTEKNLLCLECTGKAFLLLLPRLEP